MKGIQIKFSGEFHTFMKRTQISCLLCLVSPLVLAEITPEQREALIKHSTEHLAKEGHLVPDSGVQVVPMKNLKLEQWQKEKQIDSMKQKKSLGYVREYSDRAEFILNIKNLVKSRAKKDSLKFKPSESHMRASPSELLMAYTYIAVPENLMASSIGIAPSGTYTENGWSGAVQFFETIYGTCAYTENNLRVSHGAARVASEAATEEVNGKVTVVDVRGDDAGGWLYDVSWFTNDFTRRLECATKKYDGTITGKVIELARNIDS